MMDVVASSTGAPEALGRSEEPPVTAQEAVDKMVQAGLLDDLMNQVEGGDLRLTGEGGFLPELVKRFEGGADVVVAEQGREHERHAPTPVRRSAFRCAPQPRAAPISSPSTRM